MSNKNELFNNFELVGKDLSNRKLISSHAGNISVRREDKIIITRSGSMLGWLNQEDLIEVHLEESGESTEKPASTETIVHRAIYNSTDARAIIHAHNPYCTTLSYLLNNIECVDLEGTVFLENIPVIECINPTASPELAEKVSDKLKSNPVVIVKTHGVFAKGETLNEALKFITGAEQSAEIIYRLLLLGKH